MILYSDTSALAKCYLEESGSDTVRRFLEEAELRLTSAMTQLELVATIELAKRIRRINSPSYRSQVAALNKDFNSGTLSFMEISSEILKRAIPFIRVHRLKAPDAIQLATAIEGSKSYQGELHFLCADHALLDAARREGLRCKDVSH
jgi:predicted nucleic acid-binding protein